MRDPRSYAAGHHAGQTYGSEPYMVHLEAVVAIVSAIEGSEEARAVAFLHDVLEDTGATRADLAMTFGALVAFAVVLVTDPEGENRRARKALLHERLAKLHPRVSRAAHLALLVKAADRVANVRACVVDGDPSRLRMYRKEHAAFREEHAAFREAAYRPGLCDVLWTEMDALLGG